MAEILEPYIIMVMMIDKIMTASMENRGESLHLVADGIKAPLNKIRALLQSAKEKNADESLVSLLNEALTTSEDLNSRITNIVLSDIEDTEQNQEINFKELIEDVRLSLSYMPGIEKTKFILRIDDECEYRANLSLLKSIFHNLIHNAVEYRSEKVSSNMVIISVCKAGAGMVITISDNGKGIEADKIPNLFNNPTIGAVSPGVQGLGLPLVKRNVAKLGGQIKVQSQPGEGSTFTISLPFVPC